MKKLKKRTMKEEKEETGEEKKLEDSIERTNQ